MSSRTSISNIESSPGRALPNEKNAERPRGIDKSHAKEYVIAGGTAGVVARTCIAPIERVKILFQVHCGRVFGPQIYLARGNINPFIFYHSFD